MKQIINYLAFICFLIISGCSSSTTPSPTPDPPTDPDPDPVETPTIEDLIIPSGFEFKTAGQVTLEITDSDEGAYYQIYAFEDAATTEVITYIDDAGEKQTESVPIAGILNTLELASVRIVSGGASVALNVPTNVKNLLLKKRYNSAYVSDYTSDIGTARPTTISYNGSNLKTRSISHTRKNTAVDATDLFWCVNGDGGLYTVDRITMEATEKQDLDEGTWTVAMDYNNNQFYTIGKNKPYKLYRYDVDPDDDYSVSASTIINDGLGFGGPRLEYANDEGFLYFSNKNYIYKMDPSDGTVLSTFYMDSGLNNTGGGDIAKTSPAENGEGIVVEGDWFVSTFGGLYRLTFTEGSDQVKVIRKSADELDYTPTSLAVDSEIVPDAWVASNFTPSLLYYMDTISGKDTPIEPSLEFRINDLTKTPIASDEDPNKDTDGDGCPDIIDEYPNDATLCGKTVTPSKYGWGTVAFEDLWPSKGDYDFNDLVVNYRYSAMLNADNKAVKMEAQFWVRHVVGASYNNGFGFQMDNLTSDQIASVTGTALTGGQISVNANGCEANQDKAVIIVFDESQNYRNETSNPDPDYNELVVLVTFTTPLSLDELGTAPFNPFLIVGPKGDDDIHRLNRAQEVHLPNRNPTSLGNSTDDFGTINVDEDGDYLTAEGLPWAINIIHEFKYPIEKTEITDAYNFFGTWAESGGSSYPDWYKDNNGYRNDNLIDD